VALLAVACEKKEPAVAVVEGDRISQKIFSLHLDERAKMLEREGSAVDRAALENAVMEQMIAERLLVHGARDKGMAVPDEDVQKGIDMIKQRVGLEEFQKGLKDGGLTEDEYAGIIREKMLIDLFVESLVAGEAVEAGEARAFYDENPAFFERPETVLVRVIQVKTEDEARGLLSEMKEKGLTFDQLADTLGQEGRAGVGRYSWADARMFGGEISQALGRMKAGEHGGPFKGQGAFYLIRLKERKAAGQVAFDEAKDQIEEMLLGRKRQEAVVKWIDDRKKTAEIKVNLKAEK